MSQCEICNTEDTMDVRFEYPVCFNCVENFALEPDPEFEV